MPFQIFAMDMVTIQIRRKSDDAIVTRIWCDATTMKPSIIFALHLHNDHYRNVDPSRYVHTSKELYAVQEI